MIIYLPKMAVFHGYIVTKRYNHLSLQSVQTILSISVQAFDISEFYVYSRMTQINYTYYRITLYGQKPDSSYKIRDLIYTSHTHIYIYTHINV